MDLPKKIVVLANWTEVNQIDYVVQTPDTINTVMEAAKARSARLPWGASRASTLLFPCVLTGHTKRCFPGREKKKESKRCPKKNLSIK